MKTLAATLLLALATLAAPETLPAGAAKGEPKPEAMAAGKAVGVFVWADAKQVHVRWSSDGKPQLFSGALELDQPGGEIVRVDKLAGGWVQLHGDRIVMFSATAREALDGFDVAWPAGSTATLDLQLDGKPLDPALVSFGEGLLKPKALPVKFRR
jgi:hypothetical protein